MGDLAFLQLRELCSLRIEPLRRSRLALHMDWSTAQGRLATSGRHAERMWDNWLSNRVFKTYEDIADRCCHA